MFSLFESILNEKNASDKEVKSMIEDLGLEDNTHDFRTQSQLSASNKEFLGKVDDPSKIELFVKGTKDETFSVKKSAIQDVKDKAEQTDNIDVEVGKSSIKIKDEDNNAEKSFHISGQGFKNKGGEIVTTRSGQGGKGLEEKVSTEGTEENEALKDWICKYKLDGADKNSIKWEYESTGGKNTRVSSIYGALYPDSKQNPRMLANMIWHWDAWGNNLDLIGRSIADVIYKANGKEFYISVKEGNKQYFANIGLSGLYDDKKSLKDIEDGLFNNSNPEFIAKVEDSFRVNYSKNVESADVTFDVTSKDIINVKGLCNLLRNLWRKGYIYFKYRDDGTFCIDDFTEYDTEKYSGYVSKYLKEINDENPIDIECRVTMSKEKNNSTFYIYAEFEHVRYELQFRDCLRILSEFKTSKDENKLNERRSVQIEFMDDTEAMEFKKEMEERYGVNRASKYELPKGTGKRGTVFVESKLFNKILGDKLKEGSNYGHGQNDVYHLNDNYEYKHNCRNPSRCTTGDIVVTSDGDEFLVGRKIRSNFKTTMDNGARQMVFGKDTNRFETDDPHAFVETQYDTFMERETISLWFGNEE